MPPSALASNNIPDSDPPFKVDGDRPLRMKIATLVGIIIGVAGAVGYGVTLKQDVSTHGKQLEMLVIRQSIIETESRAQHDLLLEYRGSLRMMDSKLDYLTNGRRGTPPPSSVSSPNP